MNTSPRFRSPLRSALGLAGWLIVCFSVAAVGAIASIEARDFYAQLARPAWAPPGWLFGPVWSLLYFLMAIAAWLVWRPHGLAAVRTDMSVFAVKLAANALWSWLFFRWHFGALAVFEVLVLWCLVFATLVLFWRRSTLAGLLLVPYLAWVSFAAVLNYAMWQLNPNLLS